MNQALYAHMNNKRKRKRKKNPLQKSVGGVAQGEGSEFKPQYCKTVTKT
jgi:hypothetical protein